MVAVSKVSGHGCGVTDWRAATTSQGLLYEYIIVQSTNTCRMDKMTVNHLIVELWAAAEVRQKCYSIQFSLPSVVICLHPWYSWEPVSESNNAHAARLSK